MCVLFFIISLLSSFTHFCVDDVAPEENTAAPESPTSESDTAPEPGADNAEVRSGFFFAFLFCIESILCFNGGLLVNQKSPSINVWFHHGGVNNI